MAGVRRKLVEEEARVLVREWRTSGKAMPAWCAARGIDGLSMRFWAGRLDGTPELHVVEMRAPPPQGGGTPRIRLRLAGVDIVVGGGRLRGRPHAGAPCGAGRLTLPSSVRVYLVIDPVGMHQSFDTDGSGGLVRRELTPQELGRSPDEIDLRPRVRRVRAGRPPAAHQERTR